MFASDLFLNVAIILFGNYLTQENPVAVLKGKKQTKYKEICCQITSSGLNT